MQNSVAAGRRLAVRVVLVQIGVAMLAAAGFLLRDWRSGLAALAGGGVVALGTAVLALRMFAQGPADAGVTLARAFAGNLLKWVIVGAGVYLLLAKTHLPAWPVIAGVVLTVLVWPFAVGLMKTNQ